MAVEGLLTEMGLHPVSVELGVAVIEEELSEERLKELDERLEKIGFERIKDRNKQLVDKIKTLVIQKIHHQKLQQGFNWSKWLSEQVYHDYRFLSHLFSSIEGITIEQFIIKQKIEKVKELIVYGEMNFSEISYTLGYSSPAHMSNQFRKITGMTPGDFKKLRKPLRNTIDKIWLEARAGGWGWECTTDFTDEHRFYNDQLSIINYQLSNDQLSINQLTNWPINELTNDEFLKGKQRSRANQHPATSNQQPATSNKQPATSNQQPVTSNQQPATSNQ